MSVQLFIRKVLVSCTSFCSLLKFTFNLWKRGVFKEETRDCFLDVLKELFKVQLEKVPQEFVNSRDTKESLRLFTALVNFYKSTGSQVTLNQLLEILKTDFIERGRNDH